MRHEILFSPELLLVRKELSVPRSFSQKMETLLHSVSESPNLAGQIGLIPLDRTVFGANARILAHFLGIKHNSANRNLRKCSSPFPHFNMSSLARKHGLPDVTKWRVRTRIIDNEAPLRSVQPSSRRETDEGDVSDYDDIFQTEFDDMSFDSQGQ
jgi:hypothetical protein